jgi:flagellar biogenesis protein FliO
MDLLQGITIAVLVIMALAGTLFLLQRRGWVRTAGLPGVPKRLQAIERVALTPHHSLHLVRVDDRVVVVASAPAGCSLLEIKVDGGAR